MAEYFHNFVDGCNSSKVARGSGHMCYSWHIVKWKGRSVATQVTDHRHASQRQET